MSGHVKQKGGISGVYRNCRRDGNHSEKLNRGSQSAVLSICCEKVLEGTQIGDSIAVNGVCLTVTSLRSDGYDADVMAETMNRSSLGYCSREAV